MRNVANNVWDINITRFFISITDDYEKKVKDIFHTLHKTHSEFQKNL